MKVLLYLLLVSSIAKPLSQKMYLPMDKVLYFVHEYYEDCKEFPIQPNDLSELIYSSKECWKGPYALEKDIVGTMSKLRYKIEIVDQKVIIISAGSDDMFNTTDDIKSSDSDEKKRVLINLYKSREESKNYIIVAISTFALIVVILVLKIFRNRKGAD